MDVELPTTGCNIINSATSFYNYSPNRQTRQTWVIYEGKAFLQSTTTNALGYTYTGDCLSTGDLVFNPQSRIYFDFISVILCAAAILLAYKTVIWRFIK